MKKFNCSLFSGQSKKGQTPTPLKTLTFQELIAYYKSENNKQKSLAILNAPDEKQKKFLKGKRDYFTPYGVFKKRNNSSIKHFNSVAAIDIDGLNNRKEALLVKAKLSALDSCALCVISPRGKGVKALLKIEINHPPENHYNQLKHVLKPYLVKELELDAINIDNAQFVLSQAMYFSYDIEMYVNEKPKTLNLVFDYKEPELPEFKAVNVPKSKASRVEKFILGILTNRLKALTPEGARHQKLANAREVAKYLHYAPHLESEVRNSFIEQGVLMYGKESMRSNVTTSVNGCIEQGLRTPENHQKIEEILQEQKPIKTVLRDSSYTINTKYLSEDKNALELVKNAISKGTFTSIEAPTGIGKTEMIKSLSSLEKTVCLVPLTSIISQQANGGNTIKGGTTPEQVKAAEFNNLCFCTYASANKLSSVKDKIVVIDESHLLSLWSGLIFEQLRTLYKVIKEAKKVVFVSATPNPLFETMFSDMASLKFKRASEKQYNVKPLISGSTIQKSSLQFIADNKNKGITVVHINNKTAIEDIKQDLLISGYEGKEIATFTANEKDIASENNNHLAEYQLIKAGIKVVLTTSKIGEGVNIKNKEKFNVLLCEPKCIKGFNQFIGRFREAKELNISVLFTEHFYNKEARLVDTNRLYKSKFEAFSQAPKSITDIEEDEIELEDVNHLERALILVNKGFIVNEFEIINQIDTEIKEGYNFDTWKTELQQTLNISFEAPEVINGTRTREQKEHREFRKEQKKDFLTKVREDYLTEEEALCQILFIATSTTNQTLKKKIIKAIDSLEGYSFDNDYFEDIDLFAEYNEEIERYIKSIVQLSGVLSVGVYQGAQYFIEEDLHKPNKYQLQIQRLKLETLLSSDKKLNYNRDIIAAKRAYKTIEPFIKGKQATISKEKMSLILTKNQFILKTNTLQNVLKCIGNIAEITYNKHSKEYNVLLLKHTYFLTSFFIVKQTSKGNLKANENKPLEQINPNFGQKQKVLSSSEILTPHELSLGMKTAPF